MAKKNSYPKFALCRIRNGVNEEYYKASTGTGTDLKPATWVADANAATHWPSRYAAKIGREVAGLPREEVDTRAVK